MILVFFLVHTFLLETLQFVPWCDQRLELAAARKKKKFKEEKGWTQRDLAPAFVHVVVLIPPFPCGNLAQSLFSYTWFVSPYSLVYPSFLAFYRYHKSLHQWFPHSAHAHKTFHVNDPVTASRGQWTQCSIRSYGIYERFPLIRFRERKCPPLPDVEDKFVYPPHSLGKCMVFQA